MTQRDPTDVILLQVAAMEGQEIIIGDDGIS